MRNSAHASPLLDDLCVTEETKKKRLKKKPISLPIPTSIRISVLVPKLIRIQIWNFPIRNSHTRNFHIQSSRFREKSTTTHPVAQTITTQESFFACSMLSREATASMPITVAFFQLWIRIQATRLPLAENLNVCSRSRAGLMLPQRMCTEIRTMARALSP